jgi:hypothetical protein
MKTRGKYSRNRKTTGKHTFDRPPATADLKANWQRDIENEK